MRYVSGRDCRSPASEQLLVQLTEQIRCPRTHARGRVDANAVLRYIRITAAMGLDYLQHGVCSQQASMALSGDGGLQLGRLAVCPKILLP